MKLVRTSILLFISMYSLSCAPENLPISVEPADTKIAVASLVGPEDILLVSLTKSFSALSAEDIADISDDFVEALLVDSALVTLTYDSFTDTLNTFFDITGLYATELQAFEDYQLMELSVFDPSTSESIRAQSVLQPAVEIDSLEMIKLDTLEFSLTQLNLSFDDPPDAENYYVMQVYQFTPPDTLSSDTTEVDGVFFNDNNYLIYERLFTDAGAIDDGRIRREDFVNFSSPVDSALVVLTNIERGYYNFLEARGRSGNLISSLANEPVNHPTNVENGVGYFSAHQPRAKLVIVKFEDD